MSRLVYAAAALAASIALGTRSLGAQAPTDRPAADVMVVRGPVQGTDVIRTARRYMGVPYRWGGETPRGFDCSGFVQYVFAEFGIRLPRTAREQAGVGSAPFPGDLQPGDLLFFYGGQGAQHIALYMGGDSIIHASSTGGRVRIDRMSGPRTRPTWFRRRLIAVRRVLPAEGVFRLPTSGTAAGWRAEPAGAPETPRARERGAVTRDQGRASGEGVGGTGARAGGS